MSERTATMRAADRVASIDAVAPPIRRFSYLWIGLLAALLRVLWCVSTDFASTRDVSDVAGYMSRATVVGEQGIFGAPQAVMTFQAPATHWLLAICLRIGGDGVGGLPVAAVLWCALSILWAIAMIGSVRRILAGRAAMWCAVAVALWWPSIRMAGFPMSETPAATMLALALWASLTILSGRDKSPAKHPARDEIQPAPFPSERGVRWLLGLTWALAVAFRHEAALIGAPCLVFVLLADRHAQGADATRSSTSRMTRLRRVLPLVVPVAAVLALLTAHSHHHTQRVWPLAWSAPVNATMLRCHATTLRSGLTSSTSATSIPEGDGPMPRTSAANAASAMNATTHEPNWVRSTELRALGSLPAGHPLALDPALSVELVVSGDLSDVGALAVLRERCLAESGLLRTLRRHALGAVAMFSFVRPWPTFVAGTLDASLASYLDPIFMLLVQALAGCVLILGSLRVARSRSAWGASQGATADHVALLLTVMCGALLLVGGIYGGAARVRAIYDAPLLLLVGFVLAGPGTRPSSAVV